MNNDFYCACISYNALEKAKKIYNDNIDLNAENGKLFNIICSSGDL